jgi:putative endonuclease
MTTMPRQQRERWGRIAERRAAFWLRLKGYRILGQRLRTAAGEIDLVASRGRRLVFVEVKARESLRSGLEAIPPAQRRRLRRAAEALQSQWPGPWNEIRFDIVLIAPGQFPRHLINVDMS